MSLAGKIIITSLLVQILVIMILGPFYVVIASLPELASFSIWFYVFMVIPTLAIGYLWLGPIIFLFEFIVMLWDSSGD